jgi:hypothetical protein
MQSRHGPEGDEKAEERDQSVELGEGHTAPFFLKSGSGSCSSGAHRCST